MLDRIFQLLLRGATWIKNPLAMDEHFVPRLGLDLQPYIERGNVTAVHHLIRYEWVLATLSDLRDIHSILDIACGSGYGSYIIAKQFPSIQVVGADYDLEAVKKAGQAYQLPNLTFKTGDVTQWEATLGPDLYDCVISFDTIEHIAHREIMMENLVEHLDEKGCLFFSTPCGTDQNTLNPRWHFHKLEYSSASLYDFLKRYFAVVLRPDEKEHGSTPPYPHREVFDRLEGTGIDYHLRMNPVLCLSPLKFENPYK